MTLDERISGSGLSIAEVARRAGISRGALWDARSGNVNTTWDTAKAIADVLECAPADVSIRFVTAP